MLQGSNSKKMPSGAKPPGRAVIESVKPQIDCGRFPVKRAVGSAVDVQARIFTDGHDAVSARLLYRKAGAEQWQQTQLDPGDNDWWEGRFRVTELGVYEYTVTAWVDHFGSWRDSLRKKWEAGQDVSLALREGVALLGTVRRRAENDAKARLERYSEQLSQRSSLSVDDKVRLALDPALHETVDALVDRRRASFYARILKVRVDPVLAEFSAWYEMFPRSASNRAERHGTFADVEARLPYVAEMGFDILYLPPIHPIGTSYRKGPNNVLGAGPDDPGSPWAIGSSEGGHKAVHPELGTLDDFRRLVTRARDGFGIEVALDIAFQCSPDHPYVSEHPEWFKKRPDGSIQYAENPPKKYQDVYPFDFETKAWKSLWSELKSIFEFWLEQGVRVFRVDNPHTKPMLFWQWCIEELASTHPDIVLLSEAFTRPAPMYYLAKLGFNQSYTYFAWRNDKAGLSEYLHELTHTEAREYFRPSFWPNTPDILNAFLQHGGKPAFTIRLILAAMGASSYGIYGPAFELCEGRPREPGSEEYLDSEKYQLRQWDLDAPHSLKPLIGRVNQIRREHPALQANRNLRLHDTDNDELLCFSKTSEDGKDVIVTVVNLNPDFTHSGWVRLPFWEWGVEHHFQVHDLLSDARYDWHGEWNFVMLDPHVMPAHVLEVERPG